MTRLIYHDTNGQGMQTTWEAGDQLVAYNHLGVKSAVFRLISGIGTSNAKFVTNATIDHGDYTLIYIPKNGVIKNTLLSMIAYYDDVVLTQWENNDTDHLKGGEQYQGKFTYSGANVASAVLAHKLATMSINITPPANFDNKFITSVVVWNGMVRHELNVNDIIWNDVVRVHLFIHPQDATERVVRFEVKTVDNNSASYPVIFTQEFTRAKAHLAGKRYSIELNDLK